MMMNAEDNVKVRICELTRTTGSFGFNLTKSKWDPYPWVSSVDEASPADLAGVLSGDCLLEVNGEDVLGLRVAEIAQRVKMRENSVTVMLWNAGVDPKCSPEALCCGPMPMNLKRLSTCMSNILASLECPICLDTIPPPAHQCVNGHLVCLNCRVRTERCPVCRTKFCRGRSLLADQVFNSLVDAFELKDIEEGKRPTKLRERLIGNKKPLAAPKNKFLTRIIGMGKSSSVENLSSEPNLTNKESNDDFGSGLKAKSLSSNEIFQSESQPVSRTPSILSSRPGSGLLDINHFQPTKRPASYHGSADELNNRLLDFVSEIPKTGTHELFHCPCALNCNIKIRSTDLLKHLHDHKGPLIQFYQSKILMQYPRPGLEHALILLRAYDYTFVVQIYEEVTFKVNSDLRVWAWIVADETTAEKFELSVTVKQQIGLSFQCDVISLSNTSWLDVIEQEYGIVISSDILESHFHNNCSTIFDFEITIEKLNKG